MKIKVSEATSLQLDWLVAKCEGYLDDCNGWLYEASLQDIADGTYHPTSHWAQGGPIIEREGISTVQEGDAAPWVGSVYDYTAQDWHKHTTAPTPLIAAMRCYVASKLGDEVEVPEELV